MISLYRKLKQKKTDTPPAPKPCAHTISATTVSSQKDTTDLPPLQDASSEARVVTANTGDASRCEPCRQEKRAARIYRFKLILGLIFPFALQALDVTIIASALPWIAADFDEIPQLNWIISAFNLTAAAFIPFWGQLADVFGRHSAIQATVLTMMVGSALCTAAPTTAFPVLLLGRGIQGLGCAGIGVIVRVIIADKVSLRENARNWSLFSLTAGISYSFGPVLGGYLTNTNWRWCFGINLPVGLVAVILIFFILRKELLGPRSLSSPQQDQTVEIPTTQAAVPAGPAPSTFSAKLATVDYGGQFLFLFGFGLIILALTWGGATYEWNSVAVLTPLCVGVVLVVAFAFWERLMAPGRVLAQRFPRQTAMMPWDLLATKDVGLLCYINFATGAAMYSILYFCNIYFTMVKSFGPSQAGVQLLYYTPGLGGGLYLSMLLCNRFPRKTFVPTMLGSVIEAIGISLMAWALYNENTSTIYGMMALTGAGTGLRFLPVQLHAVGFFPKNIASVMSIMAVSSSFGGTFALTIMTTVFNNTSGIANNSPMRNFDVLKSLPDSVKAAVVQQAKMGIVWAFVAIIPFMILCVLAASLLGNVDIAKHGVEGVDGESPHVIRGVYLLHLLRKKRGESVKPAELRNIA